MCTSQTSTGFVLAIICTVVLLIGVSFPWYFTYYQGGQCSVFFMKSWFSTSCFGGSPYFLDAFCTCTQIEAVFKAPKVQKIFETSFALSFASLCLSTLITVYYFFMSWSKQSFRKIPPLLRQYFFVFLNLSGLALLTASFIYFAANLQPAINDAVPGFCNTQSALCSRYAGSESLNLGTLSWGPAGWGMAVLAWPLMLAVFLVTYSVGRQHSKEAEDDEDDGYEYISAH
eukprot:TRINITY_DN2983_c0_g1_i2.p1 TRINITY_DN2983_c0_g1~~TRINITY_DN2983_c0_g1_i2.p1  ORF type:complete len:243 (-),score=48.04 TRINITY_DN2983_c0_g1_i2:190-876(-)